MVNELEQLNERLKLRETEAQTFSDKYDAASSESKVLKEQLDKLGEELIHELDNQKKEHESLQVGLNFFEGIRLFSI